MEKIKVVYFLQKAEYLPKNDSNEEKIQCGNVEVAVFGKSNPKFGLAVNKDKIGVATIKNSICKCSITKNFSQDDIQLEFEYNKKIHIAGQQITEIHMLKNGKGEYEVQIKTYTIRIHFGKICKAISKREYLGSIKDTPAEYKDNVDIMLEEHEKYLETKDHKKSKVAI